MKRCEMKGGWRLGDLAAAAIGLAAILGVFAAVVALAGCGSTTTPSTATSSQVPQRGGSLTISFQSEPQNLDPAVDWELTGTQVMQAVYQGLLRYKPVAGQEGTELEPCLATAAPTPTNGGKTYVFHIRHGAKFQAPVSRQVTAADFKYSIERMMRMPLAPATYFYTGIVGAQAYQAGKAAHIQGIKAIGPYTLEFDLVNPDPAFLNAITLNFCYVVPREWVAKWGNRGFARHPLGTGPFVFEHWTSGQDIVLKRNPNYWDAGKPYLDGLKFTFSLNPTSALLGLQRGQIDVLGDGLPPAEISQMTADLNWKHQVYSEREIAGIYLSMNVQFKPFDDVKVRQALSWAIDRAKLCKLQSGQAVPLWQFLPEGLPGSEPGKVYYGYNPAKAKQMLAAAGFPNGFSTTLYANNVDPMPKLAQSIQNDLAAVGVKASIKLEDRNTFYAVQSTPHKMPLSITEWYMDFPDPSDFVVSLASKSNAVNGGMDNPFWWSPQVEQLLTASSGLSAAARLSDYTKMGQVIMANAPYATLYQPLVTTMCSKSVGGFYLSPVTPWYDLPDFWRIK